MSRYSIEDAETISRALAGGFEIPPAHVRAALYPGDLATLFFNVEGHLPGEPLRVEVLEIEGPGQYIGRLIEESGDLRFGTPIAFDERNVAWIEPPRRVAMSGIFDIWKGKEGEPPPPPPPPPPPEPSPTPSGEFIPPEQPYQFPQYPRELQRIPQESYPRPPVVYLPYRPSGMIPVEEEERLLSEFRGEALPLTAFQGTLQPPAPVQQSLFAIWNPEASLPMPTQEKAGAFSIWEKKEQPLAPIEEKAGAFSIWTPPPSQAPIVAPPPEEAGMFSVWNPQVMAAEKAAYKEMDLWEIIVPKAEQGSMYQPEGKEAFDIWQPETAPMPVAPIKPKKKKKRRVEEEELTEAEIEEATRAAERASAMLNWTAPTVKEMVAILTEALNLKKIWKMVRSDRKADWFVEEQAAVDPEGGDEGPVPIPLHTITNTEANLGDNLTEKLMEFLDLDTSVLEPFFEEYERTEDEEAMVPVNEIGEELDHLITEAFEIMKPDDLPGQFGLYSHPDWGNQTLIGYMEDPEDTVPPEIRRQRQRERDTEKGKREERRKKALKKLVGNWHPMTWEQAAEFLDIRYGLQQLAERFRRTKRTKKWKEDIETYGTGIDIVEDFGEDNGGGDLEYKVGDFLGVPVNLIDRFIEEGEFSGLWDAVFYPAFESFEQAWENIRPEDLPGELLATSEEASTFTFYYAEGEGYDDEEESEPESEDLGEEE